MPIAIQTTVERLIEARSTHGLITPPSETEPDLSLEDAYAIQDVLRTELERRGERIIGWKLAFTSPAGREAMGVDQPIAGFLLRTQYASGVEVPVTRFANVGAEVEVAFKMRSALAGPGVTAATALTAVDGALPALELPDFLFAGKARAADFVADSGHANAIVLGSPVTAIQGLDLALEGVVYEHNGQMVATHTAAEVMGNPLNALAWLANHLASRGLSLEPGDVVMSGSISKILRPKAGDTVRAAFTRLGSVSVKFV